MLFWGSGVKTKQWPLENGQILLLQWNYSHLFWCPIAYKLKWFILSDKRSEDKNISQQDALKLLPVGTQTISFWQKYGGYVLIVIFCIIGFTAK